MVNASTAPLPWALLDGVQRVAQALRPPAWAEHELHNRALLLLNHVLSQEPEAMQRLARHANKMLQLNFAPLCVTLAITPLGLLERLSEDAGPADLRIALKSASWAQGAQRWWQDGHADLDIYGDVMLAAEIGWLREHLRWEVEEDLARVLGDAAAATLCRWGRRSADALSAFVGRSRQAALRP